mgnify:CR=1 FL=1
MVVGVGVAAGGARGGDWPGVAAALAGKKLGGQPWGGGRRRRSEVGFLFFLLG